MQVHIVTDPMSAVVNGAGMILDDLKKYKKRTGIITFRVSNDLWDVFTKFAKGYREFELNKALALPTGSVSYTHLDVYKRQLLGIPLGFTC